MGQAVSRGRSIARGLLKIREWSEKRLHIQNSIIRWDVLLTVAGAEEGSILYADLDEQVGRSPRALQYVLRDLQALGMVEIAKAEHDRRCVRVSLTDRARREIEDLAALFDSVMPGTSGARRMPARAGELTA